MTCKSLIKLFMNVADCTIRIATNIDCDLKAHIFLTTKKQHNLVNRILFIEITLSM